MSEDLSALEAMDAYVDALLAGRADEQQAIKAAHPSLLDELALLSTIHRAVDSVKLDAVDEDEEDDAAPQGERLLDAGTRLGECVIEELIGAGGMGEVYRAKHEVLGRDVAVKVLRPSLADEPDAVRHFRREVKAQARISAHPNIVTANHASEHEGRLYLVMELVEGVNLRHHVREAGPLDPETACDIVMQAAKGLAHAHRAGIIHRDVKPSNLLLTPDGTVKVVDLGLAVLTKRDSLDDAPEQQTWVDELVGSLDYMPPEQARDPASADARSDLYALGCTFYFLLEGRAPFADRLALKKLMAHAVDPPPPLTGSVPTPVREVLWRTLEKEPGRRPQTADELIAALGEASSGERPTVRQGKRREAPATGAPASAPSQPGPWRGIAIGASVVAAALLVGLLYVVTSSADPAAAPMQLERNGAVTGALAEGDEIGERGAAWYDHHRVHVDDGVSYLWTLRSSRFDPILVLEAGGFEIANNDDGPGVGLTSQIAWTAERDGEVDLMATTREGGVGGPYVLTMERLERPQLPPNRHRVGRLEDGDERYWNGTLVDRYWMNVEPGQTFVVHVAAEGYQPNLALESIDREPLERGNETRGRASTVVYNSRTAGVVYAAVRCPGETCEGDYRLTMAPELRGEQALFETGELSEGDLRLAEDDSFYDPYPLSVREGHIYVITMESEEFDTYLALATESGHEIAWNDDATGPRGLDARLVYLAEHDAELIVYANSFEAGQTGRYTLTGLELPY